MRRVWMVFMLLLFMGSGIASAGAQEIKRPKAVVPEREFDFKDVDEGLVLEHAFVIRNEGEAHLNILDVKTG